MRRHLSGSVLESRLPGLVLGAGGLAFVGIVQLLPQTGLGAGVRLAATAFGVLVLPGAIVLRIIGWPDSIGLLLACSLALSLLILAVGLVVTFAVDGSITVALVVLAVVPAASLLVRGRPPVWPRFAPVDVPAALGVLVLGVVLGSVDWWTEREPGGDDLFHLGRIRKLTELSTLHSLDTLNEFEAGGPHPGYAFPLWHAALAAVARLAGLDAHIVMELAPGLLAPLALILAYALGVALFGSWVGGAATASAQAALYGLGPQGLGDFRYLADAEAAARLLLVPSVWALVFAFVESNRRGLLLPIAAASFALVAIHPNYAVFALLPLFGFVLVRSLAAPDIRGDVVPSGAALATALLPVGAFAVWLWPIVRDANALAPSALERARELAHYGADIEAVGDSFRLAPEVIARPAVAALVGLLVVPLAGLAGGRRWSALVLGGSLSILLILLIPALFTELADAASLSQARRLKAFLPLLIAFAGAATLLGRLKVAGCLAAASAAVAMIALEGGRTYGALEAWGAWIAVAGGGVGLILVRWRAPLTAVNAWAVAAAIAFLVPLAVARLSQVERADPDRLALTAGLVEAVREDVKPLAVVLANADASYRLVAVAPVRAVAVPAAHTSDTVANRPRERLRDVRRFFRSDTDAAERRRLLARYGPDWVVVDKSRAIVDPSDLLPGLTPEYEDRRYALFRLAADESGNRQPSE